MPEDAAIAKNLGDLSPEAEGAFSAEKILERLSGARSQASKEENWYFVACLLFVLFYGIKTVGLRIDLVFFDKRIFEIPYGLLLFLIISQILYCISMIRGSDARSYDRQIRYVCEKTWPAQGELAYHTFPDAQQWFAPSSYMANFIKGNGIAKLVFDLISLITMIFVLLLYTLPITCGFYYLIDWGNQISSGNVSLQYYFVLGSTLLTLGWFISYIIFHTLTEKLGTAD